MACSACQKVKMPTMESDLPYTVLNGVLRVMGKDGRRYLIQTSLIPPMREPKGGWYADFEINGQLHHITKSGPTAVFNEVKRLFNLNNVKYTDLDLWFNLNLQWTKRAVDRYQIVRYSDLLNIASHD